MKKAGWIACALVLSIVAIAYLLKSPGQGPVRADTPKVDPGREPGPIAGAFGQALQEELRKVGQISPAEFAKRYPGTAKYLDAFPWDPTTAKYYDHLQLDPNDPKSQIRATGRHAEYLRQQMQQQAIQKGLDPKNLPEPMISAKGQYDFRLSADELAAFKKNGFVVSERMGAASFIEMYYRIYARDLPVFISSDAVLHAWHHSYDTMLEELEIAYLHPTLTTILVSMHSALPEAKAKLGKNVFADSVKDADYFLAMGISLLQGFPAATHFGQDDRVKKTLAKCDSLQMEEFDLFGRIRAVDFSQFKPRGHYEKNELLRKYFKAMMWLGRIDLRVAGYPGNSSSRELGAALVLNDLLERSKQFKAWHDFDAAIQTFVGKTDSMTFAQLRTVLDANKTPALANLKGEDGLAELQKAILATKAGTQEIRGDIYEAGEPLPRSFTFLGQKFTVDSWAMNKVVYDDIRWDNQLVRRSMPSCLDIGFSVFGNDQIVPRLVERMTRMDGHPRRDGMPYQHNLAAVRNVVDRLPETFWDDNLYTHWLGALRTLSKPTTKAEYPQAMRTERWAMKSLNTQMASWTELRHDTILYVKQSYASVSCFYPAGYVEPVPEFWGRMQRMAEASRRMLKTLPDTHGQMGMKVQYCERFAETMGVLKAIAEKELAQMELTKEQTKFLRDVVEVDFGCGGPPSYHGWYPQLYYGSQQRALRSDALVADVHTDPMSGVLHQGVGNVDLMVIAIDNGADRMIYLGPTMSHYEFETKGADRRTDSEWRRELNANQAPPRPEWTRGYLVPGVNPHARGYTAH